MIWFETILVVLTLASGAIWLLDKLFLARRRAAKGDLLAEEPVLVDWSKAFFPVLAAVLILRSFIAEPFKIPSASMVPNLLIGDFILVNKFAYGLRLPITNTKVVPIGEPARGDVVVFHFPGYPCQVDGQTVRSGDRFCRYPLQPVESQNWIKRVIGLPGDTVAFQGNELTINGQPLSYQVQGPYDERLSGVPGGRLVQEDLPGRTHTVVESDILPISGEWSVPTGYYLVMGDNRDNSEDGRFWGLLPESDLRGKAFLVWLNCSDWFCKNSFEPSRIGNRIR
ncbi:signal peptidase I [Pseudoxanthomonas kalamensis DSM 18571]|uniref:signal peptidase I n=1 Tax=Pseudoxanthomonas kalamensis TaxID=289483 RepID=UPI001390FF16|nr:signal peptidase I [Pseudoxanthomonas kalamensis]KAF1709888.1 signal peptidase I [Pseudoxanthomonas kalamensis DSM 18571]